MKNQNSAPVSSPVDRLNALRAVLQDMDLNGFIVPRTDEFQNEYVPPGAERLAWLTGFTGSAGTAVVLSGRAALLTDGRYTIQARQQVDAKLYDHVDITREGIGEWIARQASDSAVIGYDPRLHTPRQIQKIQEKLAERHILLRAVGDNLIDRIWMEKPQPAAVPAELFPIETAGQTALQKRSLIAEQIRAEGCRAVILTLPESIAWLLNVRGRDVAHNPIVLSAAILMADDAAVEWFVDPAKIGADIRLQLGNSVYIHPLESLGSGIDRLAETAKVDPRPVMVDGNRSSQWYVDRLKNAGVNIRDSKDPTILPKACKNEQEQLAMRAAHLRDGVAVTKFLHWFSGAALPLTEIDIADKLESFRREDPAYRDSSFDTISGWNGNGAIVHYRATLETNATVKGDGILLLDSGAQYADGTTDITRTMAIGSPTVQQKLHVTTVLKGHIALARAVFPQGTTGAQLDAIARHPLWEQNMDYAHGTGHGVGCYLSVHEEAASISPRGQEVVMPGMILSNEPGYYREGEYGIRLENLILCRPAGQAAPDGRPMLMFDTITLAPFDRRLIDPAILSVTEKTWLNDYHARVLETLRPHLPADVVAWLEKETAPL